MLHLCSPRALDQPLSTEPYRCALSARAAAPRAPPPPSSPEPTTLSSSRDAEESYRSCAAAAKSLRDASPHRSSSGHACTTPSTAQMSDAFPPQQPAANDRRPPLHADPLRPTAHRRGARSTVSFSSLHRPKSDPPSRRHASRPFPPPPLTTGHRNRPTPPSPVRQRPGLPCLPCFAQAAQPWLGRPEAAQVHSEFS
jgi:hypothetical protein